MTQDQLFLISMIILLFFLIVLGMLFWYLLQRKKSGASARIQRAETLNRLVDKFSTSEELATFLKSEEGKKLLELPALPRESPHLRVIRLVQVGGVFLFIGIAFLISAARLADSTDIYFLRQGLDHRLLGLLSVALGAGLLCVSFVTSALVKRWGLNGQRQN